MPLRACLLLVAALSSCDAQPAALQATRLFGPVIGPEPIVGRADLPDGRILLLVRGAGLVSIDLERRAVSTAALPAAMSRTCWGLARLPDGSLWTLADRHTLARVTPAGEVGPQFQLSDPHFGLVGSGNRLVYERMAAAPGEPPVYESGPPGQDGRARWTGMQPRAFALSAVSALPLNLFACGETRTNERPCWFPDDTSISLIDEHGAARRVPLDGLTRVAPEVLLTAETPARPIRGAYVAADGIIWILSSGTPPPGASGTGAWLLARYRRDGTPVDLRPLPAAARAILQIDDGRAVVLAADGQVVEIRM